MTVYSNRELCIKSHKGTSRNGILRAFFKLEEANDVLAKIKQKHAYKQTPEYIQEEEDKRQILLAKQRVRNRIVEKAKSTEEKVADQTRQKKRRLQYSESRTIDNEIKKEIRRLRTNAVINDNFPERDEMFLKGKISELGNSSDFFNYKASIDRKEEGKAIVILEKKYMVDSVIRDTTAFLIAAKQHKDNEEVRLEQQRKKKQKDNPKPNRKYKEDLDINRWNIASGIKYSTDNKTIMTIQKLKKEADKYEIPCDQVIEKRIGQLTGLWKDLKSQVCGPSKIDPLRELWYTEYRDIFQISCACILSLNSSDVGLLDAQLALRKYGFLNYDYLLNATQNDLYDMQCVLSMTGYNHFNDPPATLIAWAKGIHEYHNGKIPNKLSDLTRFFGIGIKCACLIQNDVLGKHEFPVIDSVLCKILQQIKWTKCTKADEIAFDVARWLPDHAMGLINTVFGSVTQVKNTILKLPKPEKEKWLGELKKIIKNNDLEPWFK